MKLLMTLIAIYLISLAANQRAMAQSLETATLKISDITTQLLLKLDPSTVRCLVGDYGASSLKISVPQLTELAVFNHTTTGEVLPCINAGRCEKKVGDKVVTPGLNPEMILDAARPTEQADVRVQLEEDYYLDHALKTCAREVSEKVTTTVRGLPFRHIKSAPLAEIPYDVCLRNLGR